MSTMVAGPGPAYYNTENSARHQQTIEMAPHEPTSSSDSDNTSDSQPKEAQPCPEMSPADPPEDRPAPPVEPPVDNGAPMVAVLSSEFCAVGQQYTPPPLTQPQGAPAYCSPEFYPGDVYYPGPPVPDYCQHNSMCTIHGVPGPATVRMVSTNSSPPIPLPVQMPPGHIVQQIVDETGTLQHVILSTQPMTMPVCPYSSRGNQGPHQYYNPSVSPHPSQGYIPGYQNPHQYSPVMSPSLAQTTSPPPAPHHNYKHDRNPRHVDKTRKFNPRHNHGPNHNFTNHQKPPPNCNTGTPPLSPKKDIMKMCDRVGNQTEGQKTEKPDAQESQIQLKQLLSDVQAIEVSDITAYSATLHWKPPDLSTCPAESLGKGIVRYEVFLGNHFHASSTNTQYSLTNLAPGTEYKVYLICMCNGLRGKACPSKSFHTKASRPDPPQPPRLIEKSKNSLFFRWSNCKDNGAKITHYTIEVLGGDYNSWTEVYRNRNKQFSIQKLKPQTAYKIRLAAINDIGKSLYSAEISECTAGLAPSQPQPPSLKKTTVNTLTLSWEKRPVDDCFTLQMEDPFSDYGFQPIYNGRELSYHCMGLERNSDYKFRLRSQNVEGSSPFSNIVSYTTLPDRPMPPPSPAIKGKVGHDRLTIAWTSPSDQGGSSIDKYEVEMDKGQGFEMIYSGEGLECEVDNLTPGKNYRVRCLAESSGGKSNWSSESTVTTKAVVPTQCPSPKPIGKPKATTLQLKWAHPDFDGGSVICEFHLDMVSPSSERRQVYCGRDTECTVASLLPGRSYIFLLRAANKIGPGPWSEPTEVISGAGPPEAPRISSVACKNSQTVSATWDEPINNGASVRQYTIQYAQVHCQTGDSSETSQEEGSLKYTSIQTGTNTTAELTNLSPASSYSIRVAASNISGMGPWSMPTTVTTPSSVPDAVYHVTSESECHAITLRWKPPHCNGEPIIYYEIDLGDRMVSTASPVEEFVVDELEAETVYKIRVRAVNSVGNGPYSSSTKVCTKSPPPQPPRIELVKASYNSLRLKWGDGKNFALLNYTLEMEFMNNKNSMEFFPIYSGTNQNFKVVKLEENTTYKFRLCASSEAGVGPFSQPVQFNTTKAPPLAPKAPRATESQSGTYCIEWSPLRCPSDEKITYKLQLMQVGKDKEYTQAYCGPELSHILTELPCEHGYYVRVCGVRTCSDGDVMVGAYSSPVYFFTPKPSVADAQPLNAQTRKASSFQWNKLSDQEKAFGMVLMFFIFAFLATYLVSLAAQNVS